MPAPKGNKYAIGNNGGRPPIYDNPDDLQIECDAYFEWIKGEHETSQQVNSEGKIENIVLWKRAPEPATITGLALFLGFCHRNALDEYEKKEVFCNIIKRARSRVEMNYESRLSSTTPTGAIFALKNMGWKDKTEVEQSGTLAFVWNEIKNYGTEPETDQGT